MSDVDYAKDQGLKVTGHGESKTPGAPGVVAVPEDPAAPSKEVSGKKQSLSDLFTIVSSFCAPSKLNQRRDS